MAAGRGERLGGDRPKAFVEVAGRTLLRRSAEALASCPSVGALIIVAPEHLLREAGDEAWGTGKLRAVVAGGATRQDSVRAGLAETVAADEVVLVHDAARPFVTSELVTRVVEAARASGAAIPVAPVVDTIKRVRAGRVGETVDRESLGAAQTPQGFDRRLLLRAYAAAARDGVALTDEAMAMERVGRPVTAVPGSVRNFKITTAEDLDRARALLSPSGPVVRVGLGFDMHRLTGGRRLMLGGVPVESSVGLDGHSDGDVLLHALCDALLGAAALGEIGALFPSSDPRLRGADSRLFVSETRARLASSRLSIVNIDATLIAERPRLSAHLPAMKASIASLLELEPGKVSVKVKSADQLGALGRGEGIAAQVLALLAPS